MSIQKPTKKVSCGWRWKKRMWYLAKVRTYSLWRRCGTCTLYMCVLVIVDAKCKQNFKHGLCTVWVRSVFSAGETAEDHNKVSEWGKEMGMTRQSFLGQCNMFFSYLERTWTHSACMQNQHSDVISMVPCSNTCNLPLSKTYVLAWHCVTELPFT